VITIFAPTGIGEVTAGSDVAALVLAAVAEDPAGPLQAGDIVVVTSKIISKAAGLQAPAAARAELITADTVRTVARRGETRIVRTRSGLTLAAAGVDNSNVARDEVIRLPADSDTAAVELRTELQHRTGLRLGVIVSDTAGRAWRIGQTDQAIGAAGVQVVRDYAGQTDAYGNDLQVTMMAVGDELAAAADLAKAKLAGRPVAVVRGLSELVTETETGAAQLLREPELDLFGLGSQEAVLAAVLSVTGQTTRYEELLACEPADRIEAVLAGCGWAGPAAETVRALLLVDLTKVDLSIRG